MTSARACLAVSVFFLLAGTAYGASQLARNSVKTRHLAPSAVTAAEVRNGSLARRDLSTDLLADRTARGPRGGPGAPGPAGDTGVSGPAGVDGFGSMYAWVESSPGANHATTPPGAFILVFKLDTGRYRVNFYEPVSDCVLSPAISQERFLAPQGPIPPGTIGLHRISESEAIVSTYAPGGAPADRAFLVTIFC
jgi:hypothetical protein